MQHSKHAKLAKAHFDTSCTKGEAEAYPKGARRRNRKEGGKMLKFQRAATYRYAMIQYAAFAFVFDVAQQAIFVHALVAKRETEPKGGCRSETTLFLFPCMPGYFTRRPRVYAFPTFKRGVRECD